MRILILNVGSSSIKYRVYEAGEGKRGKGLEGVERVEELEGAVMKEGREGNEGRVLMRGKIERIKNKKEYQEALKKILKRLEKEKIDFELIGHRIVHGKEIAEPSMITKKVLGVIEKGARYAPLHNLPELLVIKECQKLWPEKEEYAVFDTSFFTDLPEKAKIYPIPWALSKRLGIKKYGFHGNSHKYVIKKIEMETSKKKGKLGKKKKMDKRKINNRTISCHLGNGCSVAAAVNGNPIDTSMGLTPMEGLMMASRCGDIDPGAVLELMKMGVNVEEVLNYQSGFRAFSKYTDIRDVLKHLDNPRVKLAYEIFIYRIVKYIGAYAGAMNGLDNLIFTGGIGENSTKVREDVCRQLSFLGGLIDKRKNKLIEKAQKNGKDKEEREIFLVSKKNSKIKIWVVKTDEEKTIANEILNLKKERRKLKKSKRIKKGN